MNIMNHGSGAMVHGEGLLETVAGPILRVADKH